jgi:hypothetical protein
MNWTDTAVDIFNAGTTVLDLDEREVSDLAEHIAQVQHFDNVHPAHALEALKVASERDSDKEVT